MPSDVCRGLSPAGRQLLPPRTLRAWLAGLQNHKRRFLKWQSVRILARKYFKDVDVVLGNRTASLWSTSRLGVFRALSPHASRVGVALFKEKLKMTSRNAVAMYRETGGGSEF